VKLFFIFIIFAFLRQVCRQGHESRSNVVVSYEKDSHYATALCGVVCSNYNGLRGEITLSCPLLHWDSWTNTAIKW